MLKTILVAVLAAALPAMSLHAQEAPKTDPAPAAESVGTPNGPKVDATSINDWRVECYEPAVNGLKCQMLQQLVEKELNKVVLITSLAYLPATEKTQIQIVLPLGFLLKRGVELKAGEYTSTIAVDRCTAQGCFVEGAAAPELIKAFRGASEATISIVADNGQTVRVPFSLAGFTKAYEMVEQRNKEEAAKAPKADAAEAKQKSKEKGR